jgi:hypothetical protein
VCEAAKVLSRTVKQHRRRRVLNVALVERVSFLCRPTYRSVIPRILRETHSELYRFLQKLITMQTIQYVKIQGHIKVYLPLQNPTLGVLVLKGSNVLRRQTGLWSTEVKVWVVVPKAAWHWGGDSSVTIDHFWAPGCTPMCTCLPLAWALLVVTV